MANYNQRALLVRVLCNLEDAQCCRSQDNTIESVKFFTRENGQPEVSEVVYDCHDSFDQRPLEDFYETINSFLEPFEQSDITSEYWKDIVRCLQLYDFKYKKVDKVECWFPQKSPKSDKGLEEAYAKLSTGKIFNMQSFAYFFICTFIHIPVYIKIRSCGMIANETTIHQSSNKWM